MKKWLLIIGIVVLAAGFLFLLGSAFNRFGYYNLMDGSADLYILLHQRMIVCFIIGIALTVIGAGCLVIGLLK